MGGATLRYGPSPRVRGIHADDARRRSPNGSIPARAGNPGFHHSRTSTSKVHPRACGESEDAVAHGDRARGPSPRVRGIHGRVSGQVVGVGSIPARAGNPAAATAPRRPARVHPRACGESSPTRSAPASASGPSPRVRGIHRVTPRQRHRCGSIPARAGNPGPACCCCSSARVHPRACGESTVATRPPARSRGPSPRVRGILGAAKVVGRKAGSIPARAGNPADWSRRTSTGTVHPRACGESPSGRPRKHDARGPSPRVRGIRNGRRADVCRAGSIPARAGNPTLTRSAPRSSRVHPRACGESRHVRPGLRARPGPSPRVRGIPRHPPPPPPVRGSIPARAGNPRRAGRNRIPRTVHPRACGESRGDTGVPC